MYDKNVASFLGILQTLAFWPAMSISFFFFSSTFLSVFDFDHFNKSVVVSVVVICIVLMTHNVGNSLKYSLAIGKWVTFGH